MEPFEVEAFLAQEEIAQNSVDVYAILAAFENGIPEAAVDIIMEIVARGDEAVIDFITVMSAGMGGLIQGNCEMTGTDPRDFLASAGLRAAQFLAQAGEMRRQGMI